MKINVKAKPSSGRQLVEKIDETHFTVWVKEPPAKGLANKGVANALAEYFNVPKSNVIIKFGHTSRNKIFEVLV